MKKMISFLAIILFASSGGLMAQQATHYFIRITDYFVYTIQEDNINGLQITSNVSVIDEIFNRSHIKYFERLFPDATDWAREIHYVVCYNENLDEELDREEFKRYIFSVENLGYPITSNVPNVTFQKNVFWQQGNYLVFGENTNQLRTINIYSVIGAKVLSIQSAENKINLSFHLIQTGTYIVEILENGSRYSGHFINQ